ncbi:hypothetical protein M5X00_13085 [Paenibacillus alvei]|uniref:hypothetical protein n=1 Tax=Paenibacillus alvei TaxID=44250 RepID=UPI000289F01F|nr:hypothetical protein [Paenibacillus alvei]EJW13814.1 hypothetical protein PAV_109p00440 [Paenibacillus alvei DSM 29]MCY9540540.1 hypothetical protein [Paenibacillus alvei]MCY9708255.1 hypothetical protein [Paenibacillus alvei]MCY9732948.1 hypothetical protein [Paenibacillus alvei]MCY9755175.1 hypothetical protein [Paenibacillus alvei]
MNQYFSLEDFIIFTKAYVELNHFDFVQEDIMQPDPEIMEFYYNATYRDEDNYKSNVRIMLDSDGSISWEVMYGWEDAEEEIEELFELFITWSSGTRSNMFKGGDFLW